MTLSTLTQSIALPDPKYPGSIYRTPNQRISENQVAQIGGDRVIVGVNWDSITKAKMIALEKFIRESLIYSGYTCTIEGLLGEDYERMRYTGGMETARVRKGDLWSVSLRFEQARIESLPLGENLIRNPNITLHANRRSAEGWNLAAGDGAVFSNVDISEDFAETALNVSDYDASSEIYPSEQIIPIYDLRYTVSARLLRTNSRNTCSVQILFLNQNKGVLNPIGSRFTGWVGTGGRFEGWVLVHFTGSEANSAWKKGEVTFGPGSPTFVPPSAKYFRMAIQNDNTDGGATVIYRVTAISVKISP